MAEFVFPIAAVLLTFGVIVPALTLICRYALAAKRRRERVWSQFGGDATFAWIVAPTLLPVLWLVSSALHQAEPGRDIHSCVIDHVQSWGCSDAAALVGLLLAALVTASIFRIRRETPRLDLAHLEGDHPHMQRVRALIALEPRLKALTIVVVRHAPAPVFTLGWLRPKVVLDACFVRDADDQMLRAALFHEVAHIDAYDTTRASFARLCLSLNPLGHLLAADFSRWLQAREASCDSRAVELGGDPLALAEGILSAARSQCSDQNLLCGAAMLCGHDAAVLKLRVALLMNGHEAPTKTVGHLVLLVAAGIALSMPHVVPGGGLDAFHVFVESGAQQIVSSLVSA